jgi:hypothetical protein
MLFLIKEMYTNKNEANKKKGATFHIYQFVI